MQLVTKRSLVSRSLNSTKYRVFILTVMFIMACLTYTQNLKASPPYFPETPVLNPDLTNASGVLEFSDHVPGATVDQIRSDLHTLFVIKASKGTDLQKKIFRGTGGKAYQHYFLSLVDHIEYDAGELGGAIAYVNFDLFKMYLTPYYLTSNMPLIARLSILLHEARHSDDSHDSWLHVNCPVPFKNSADQDIKSLYTGLTLEGQAACDETEMGAYGSSAVFLKNVEDYCENCSSKVKMDASLFAKDQASRIIDPDARARLEKDFIKPK